MAIAMEDLVRQIVREELERAQTPAVGTTAAVAAKRGRGRPPVGEAPAAAATTVAASTVTTPTTSEPDPFAAAPVAPVAPVVTIEEVRDALVTLKKATTQERALAVLNAAGGVDNLPQLTADKYAAVVVAAKAALPGVKTPEPVVEDDPFAATVAVAPAVAEKLSREDIRELCVTTQKRAAGDVVQKIIMKHGGKGKNAATGQEGPSLPLLPESAFAAVAAELRALPTTK